MTLLTKSRYMIGLQCPKYLWMIFHEPEKVPDFDDATLHRFSEGHLIGDLAKKLFPGGIDIPTQPFMENIRKTKNVLVHRVPMFEAGFMANNLFSRADILNPVEDDKWDMIEVKSSTRVKDENIEDVSFQKHCYELSGLKIRKCFIAHIDTSYLKKGEIDPKGILKLQDITSKVEEKSKDIQKRIDKIFKIIYSKGCPEIKIGNHCNRPYECPLKSCWEFLPDHHVFDLHRGGETSFELFERGIYLIAEIPEDVKLTEKQSLQLECAKTGKTYIHKEGIKSFLSSLQEPLYYLDFETINPVIPMYDGTHPYQRIPFQYSLHIIKQGEIEHHSFLAEGPDDPRKKFLSSLKEVLGDSGSIVVYSQSFEKGMLHELASAFPEYKDWVDLVDDRIVDLIIPFRSFHYYNPMQKGSASLKKVLPAVTGKSYDNLNINNGGDVSLAFLKSNYNRDILEEEKQKIRKDLEEYCGLDTEGMMWIVDKLKELAE